MLAIITCWSPGNMIFKMLSNYSFKKYWQLCLPEILVIMFFRNVSNHILRNAGDEYQQLFFENSDEC